MDYEYSQEDKPEDKPSSFSPHPEEETAPPQRRKHSGPGIASFVMSLISIAGYVSGLSLFLVTLYRLGLKVPDEQEVLNQQGFISSVLILMATSVVNIAGVITSIIGLAIKERKKVFAVLGLILGLLPLVFLVIMFIIGVTAAGGNSL